MMRRQFITAVGGAEDFCPISAVGEPRICHVGVLGQPAPELWQVFTEVLRARGRTEGQNIAFDIRSPDGHPERFPALAGKFLQLLQEVRPGISRIAVLWTPDDQGSAAGEADAVATAPGLGRSAGRRAEQVRIRG
jgi:hypothetical protein